MRPEQGITLYPHLTQEFLRAAIADGAHKRRPPHVSESAWVRQKNMLGISVGTGRATYQKLGEVYKVTPSRIGQINTQAYTNLWRVSSDQLKESFSLASLNLRRSKPPDRLPWQKPIRILSKIEQLAKRLPHAKTDKEIQAVLNQVSRHDLMVDRRRKDRLLLPVTNLIGIGHFHFPKGEMRPFLTALENAGIPRVDIPVEVSVKRGAEKRTVTRHYRIIAARHEDRALTALLEDPNLQKFSTDPLVQVCGPKVKERPKTWKLAQQVEFNALTPLFLELGIGTVRHPKYEPQDLLTQTCPVPIYHYRRRYLYQSEDEGQLREFLEERKKSIERQELLQLLREIAKKGEDAAKADTSEVM